MPDNIPLRIVIAGLPYVVGGLQEEKTTWRVRPVPSQESDPPRERRVNLGRGSAGLTTGRRMQGAPAFDGVADVVNGDTSIPNTYGAGPALTTISSLSGTPFHRAGSIGLNAIIGTGGASIGAGLQLGEPTAIWAAGADDDGAPNRYIYVQAGGRTIVVNPVTDTVVERTEHSSSVTGGDVERFVGKDWLALQGSAADVVRYLDVPYQSPNGSQWVETDFAARYVTSVLDSLYFAQVEDGNEALIRFTNEQDPALVLAANLAPTDGNTVGDLGTPITRLKGAGERLLIGKEDGLHEFDRNLIARRYLDWLAGFRWTLQCNAILPLGVGGESIVTFRRGLWLFPANKSIGVEQLAHNTSEKRGRYTYVLFDGTWVWAFLRNEAVNKSFVIKMRPRQLPGPGLFEHHPQRDLGDVTVRAAFLWPGATISGTSYGPRLFFGNGSDTLSYLNVGDTQPDQYDESAEHTTGAWSITWPLDDFGTPGVVKQVYRVEAHYEGVENEDGATDGISWLASSDGETYLPLSDTGESGGSEAVRKNGYQVRYGRRDGAHSGEQLSLRMSGTGGDDLVRQEILGEPAVSILELPAYINEIETALVCGQAEGVDARDAWQQLVNNTGKVVDALFDYGDGDIQRRPVRVFPSREGSVADPEPGTIVVGARIRTVDYGAGSGR